MFNRPKVVSVCWLSLLLCSVVLSAAQSAPTPRHVIIRAGHLLDVKTGTTLSGQAIEIEGDKIVSVGPASGAKTAAGFRSSIFRTRLCSPASSTLIHT
jgi:hypothetical protein